MPTRPEHSIAPEDLSVIFTVLLDNLKARDKILHSPVGFLRSFNMGEYI